MRNNFLTPNIRTSVNLNVIYARSNLIFTAARKNICLIRFPMSIPYIYCSEIEEVLKENMIFHSGFQSCNTEKLSKVILPLNNYTLQLSLSVCQTAMLTLFCSSVPFTFTFTTYGGCHSCFYCEVYALVVCLLIYA